MSLNKEQFINNIKDSFMDGHPEGLTDEDMQKLELICQRKAELLGNVIHDYIVSATVIINTGIDVGNDINPDKYVTTSQGNGYLE